MPVPETDTVRVKICGLTSVQDLQDAATAGASYAGLVFFPASPRAITPAAAADLVAAAPHGLIKVGLLVDADDALVDAVAQLPIDMLQLHGQEPPARVAELRARTGLRIMKAIGVRDQNDLAAIDAYAGVADQVLIDAKPPAGATRPGGNAQTIDWRLLRSRRWQTPWMLAGGLSAANVAEAVQTTRTRQVDVSSAVEVAPGIKNLGLMRAFVQSARNATAVADAP